MPIKRYPRQLNPLIPTEVFIELNPELLEFIETTYLPYKNAHQCNPFRWNCYPRRLCLPRPCPPV